LGKLKSFQSHKGRAHSRAFISLGQTPCSRSCKSADTWSACLAPSLYAGSAVPILLGEQRHTCVNNLPRVVTWRGAAGTRTCKAATVQRHAITTTPPRQSGNVNKKDGYRQLNVRQLGSLRPWDHRGKLKRIQCLSNASQHVPTYLQPFTKIGEKYADSTNLSCINIGNRDVRVPSYNSWLHQRAVCVCVCVCV